MPIASEFGWSYTQVSFAASIRGFETTLLAPLIGFIIDRFGPRRLVFAGAFIIGLGLLLLSRINSILTLYGAFILMAMGLSSCSGVILTTVVGNWFKRRISLAAGIAVCGSAFGGLLVPVVTRLIDIFEWRTAMVIIGLGAWCILLPLSFLVRHKPEQYGYLPDGDVITESTPTDVLKLARSNERDIGVVQTLKSRAFWHISLGFMCHLLVVSAVLTHIMPYLSSIHIPRSTSSLVASGIPLASVLGRLSFGWFGDRFDKRRVIASGFFITILGLLILGYINTPGSWLLTPFILLFGFGFGGPVPMTLAVIQEYFGRFRLGTILGVCMGVMMIGNIIRPPLAGWVFDRYGSYQGAWFAFIGIIIAGIICMITAPSIGATARTVDNKHKAHQ